MSTPSLRVGPPFLFPLPMASPPGSPRKITGTATSSSTVFPLDPVVWCFCLDWA